MYYYKSATDTVPMLLILLFSLTVLLQFQGKAVVALPGSSCQRWCGDVEIIYPFGIGAGCAMKGFELDCNKTSADAGTNVTFLGTMPLLNISLLQGVIRVTHRISSMCYNQSTRNISYKEGGMDLNNPPFTFSEQRNKFTVIGFNAFAYMIGTTNVLGCLAQSGTYNNLTAQDGFCDGVGCCQVALTGNMSYYYADFLRQYNTTNMSTTDGAEYCDYAVMMEARAFHFRTTYLNTTEFWKENDGRVPVILNWAVGNETCDIAKTNATSYACVSNNSTCIDSVNGLGYLCNCTEGYTGNPYLPDGCQDIDECAVNVPPPCPGHCKNTNGSFICPDQKPPSSLRYGTVVLIVGPSIGVVIVVIALTCTYLILERKKLSNIKQKYFQQHGGMMLLQEISLKQGTGFSIFTEAELIEATDKFDDKNILGRGGHGTVYKGLLKDGSLIAVKRCVSMTSEQQKKEFGKEMLILSQINHKNIVKLLGCCLEVEVPMLVYEFIPNGTLFQFIHGDNGSRNIPFSTRIRIALESALALSYLHSWASPPILHGGVKSSNILLDENYEAKVSDFGASILAPADKSQFMTLVQGTCGYLDPEYMQTCQLTDKSDVYSFGVVLLELLTGSTAFNLEGPENERSLSLRFLNAMKEDKLVDIIDSRIKADGSDNGLLEEVAELARQCLDMIGERRPAMRDVAEKLDRLAKVMQHPWVPAQHNPEEMESLLGESSVASLEMISTGNFSMEKRIVQGLLDSGR
ncbi:putative wall-associated receptor kinase-like 16 [Miscanthus floridulus]|uniref:putative wall-associated receptor kinase-like 16 n=1 Tax=Miscanthus floridulus TaxID=154761 RepID=UPI0034580424